MNMSNSSHSAPGRGTGAQQQQFDEHGSSRSDDAVSEAYVTEDPYVHSSFARASSNSPSPSRIRRAQTRSQRDASWSPRNASSYQPQTRCSSRKDASETGGGSSLYGWHREREDPVQVDDSQLKQENRKGGIVSRACLESDSDDDSLIGWNN